jgi:hypothetical protein
VIASTTITVATAAVVIDVMTAVRGVLRETGLDMITTVTEVVMTVVTDVIAVIRALSAAVSAAGITNVTAESTLESDTLAVAGGMMIVVSNFLASAGAAIAVIVLLTPEHTADRLSAVVDITTSSNNTS